jgi:hypothetical protein
MKVLGELQSEMSPGQGTDSNDVGELSFFRASHWNFLGVVAGELGFEPRLTESESAVLPLNYSPKPLRNKRFSFRGNFPALLRYK